MNNLDSLINAFHNNKNQIYIDKNTQEKAFKSTNKMIEFAKNLV